ncbi:MAG: glycosyltransferase family 39 protein [Chloroflexota bacterium]
MRRLTRWAFPMAVIVLLVGAGLRFHALGAQSLWNDEGSSYVQATRTFQEIAVNAAADIHPPLYYWTLRVWRGFTGDTEFALRSLSALAGVLTIAFAYGAGLRLHPSRRSVGRLTGLAAATLVALNTFQIYYSQEARMYAALALWGTASLWALAGFFNRPNWRRGGTLGVVNALGLWTQYAFPLVMLAQLAVAVLWLGSLLRKDAQGFRRTRDRFGSGLWRYIAANALALLLFAPLTPTAIRQVTTWPNTGDASVSVAAAYGELLRWYTIGITHPVADVSWVAVALVLVLFGLHSYGADRSWQRLAPLMFALIPTAIFVGAGLFREGNIKFLLPAGVAFALAVGQGIAVLAHFINLRDLAAAPTDPTLRATYARRVSEQSRKGRARLVTALASGAALLGLVSVLARAVPPLYTEDYARNDYRAIAAQIAADDSSRAVILNAPGQSEVFFYYYKDSTPVLRIPAGLNSTDDEIREDTEAALTRWDQLYLVLWGDAERDPRSVVESTLDANAYEVSSEWFGDVRLVRYHTEPNWMNTRLFPRTAFGDTITLQEVLVQRLSLAPGDVLPIKVIWEATATPPADYRVFVQLLDEDGALVAARDAVPVGWARPTTTWAAGEQIIDRHALLIPQDMPSSNLTLIIGLYNPAQAGERLPVDGQPQNFYPITPITITEGNP